MLRKKRAFAAKLPSLKLNARLCLPSLPLDVTLSSPAPASSLNPYNSLADITNIFTIVIHDFTTVIQATVTMSVVPAL